MASVKQCLFLVREFARDSRAQQEGMDMLLTMAAFDQVVSVLYLDEGVRHLVDPASDPVARLAAFDLYDIRHVWVERESLVSCSVNDAQLPSGVTVLPRERVSTLWARHDIVLSVN